MSGNEPVMSAKLGFVSNIRLTNVLCCAILNIEREAREAAYPRVFCCLTLYSVSRQLLRIVGGYFRLSLKIL